MSRRQMAPADDVRIFGGRFLQPGMCFLGTTSTWVGAAD